MLATRNLTRTSLLKVALTEHLESMRACDAPTESQHAGSNGARFRNVLTHAGCCTIVTDVVAWGIRMARANSAKLDIVHYAPEFVDGKASEGLAQSSEHRDADVLELATRRLTDAIGTARRIAGETNGSLSSPIGVRVGNDGLIASLIQEIDKDSADLLVLDAEDMLNGQSRLASILRRGSHRAGLSVLLVRPAGPSGLRQVTACVDFTPSSLSAARQALRLARSCGAALRFVCPYHLAWTELQGLAETHECAMDPGPAYERLCGDRLGKWLGLSPLDLADIDVACPEVPNWDYQDGLVHALDGEKADMVVLSPHRHSFFAGLQDASLIKRIASVVTGSLLIMRG